MKTKLSDVKKLEHYIFVIAKNECIRLNKREKKYTAIQNERTELYEDNATTFDAIIPIILGLPTQYVEVAKRFYIEGLSMIEIGTQLKLSRQAIKTRLFRSRKLIIKQAKQMGLT